MPPGIPGIPPGAPPVSAKNIMILKYKYTIDFLHYGMEDLL
jgi:hypothetical protein